MIELLLREFNIQVNEAKVYLALAESGKATASFLAKKLQIPRSSVYTLLDSLIKKNLITVEQTKEVSFYIANKPNIFKRIIDDEKRSSIEALKHKEETAVKLMPLLEPYFKQQNFSIPKLQFFEGAANITEMIYNNCRIWQQSIAKYDLTWWGYQDYHFVETYREWLDYYWASLVPGEQIKLLSNRTPIESKLKGKIKGRNIKITPNKFKYSSSIWVLGDYVITVMTRQKPHYAIVLQDSVFAANQRSTFQMLWELL